MKVHGPTTASPFPARSAARPAADGFAPARESEAASPAARASPAGAVGSLEALLALQEAVSPQERRRRAVRRGGRILDALDALKLAALDPGAEDATALHRLSAAVREAREGSDEPGLEDILDQIEVRAAVEMAKRASGPSI